MTNSNPTNPTSTWAVVYNSVAHVRSENRHAAELVTQVLLGTPVRIIGCEDEWRKIETPDLYTGWVIGAIQPMTDLQIEQYHRKPKLIVTSLHATAYTLESCTSQPLSDLVAGSILSIESETDLFFRATYPDGRQAFVSKTDAQPLSQWLGNITISGKAMVETARRFMGIPYLWGGASSKGMDCSGLVKMVCMMHGIIVARDARQQAQYGTEIDADGQLQGLEPGDLLFFGEKEPHENVVHVGLYVGDNCFIHASDYVRLSSFDPNHAAYDQHNANRYLRARRITDAIGTAGIEPITENEFYNKA